MDFIKSDKLSPVENFTSTDPKESVKIIKTATEVSPREPLTVPELLSRVVEENGDRIAMMYESGEEDGWTPVTYAEYKQRAEQVAKAFIKLGLEEHGSVAVLAFNSVEWFLSQLGAIHAGGQIVGIYNTNSPDACHFVLEESRASIVVVDDDEQLNKILKIRDKLPLLKAIVKTLPSHVDGVLKWSDLEGMNTDDVEDEYRRRSERIKANSCCCIVFTSGTTGNPKGAMISHDNLIWTAQNVIDTLQTFNADQEVVVSYLPLSHVAAQLVDIFLAITLSATVYFADRNALKGTLIKTLLKARPTLFFGVPRIYEKMQEKLTATLNESGMFKKHLVAWAQSTALNHHKLCFESGKSSSSLRFSIASKILGKVKAAMGLERSTSRIIGSAPTGMDTLEFFWSLDLPLFEGLGLTETGAACFTNTMREMKLGTLGKSFPGLEGKILNPDEDGVGEILTRGRNVFMGYINEAEKTKEGIDDECWVHTGDAGYFDNEGFLHLTGRIKELIITAAGENIPFPLIEKLVRSECDAISNAFLVGDKRKFLTMLITLKTEVSSTGAPCDELAPESLNMMRELGLHYKLLSEILNAGPDANVLAALQGAIDRANRSAISKAQKIQKFALLASDFSMATGEINPTMKLKRGFVLQKYEDTIEKFYL